MKTAVILKKLRQKKQNGTQSNWLRPVVQGGFLKAEITSAIRY